MMKILKNLFIKKKVPYIPQMEATECGAASLAMVLAFHGLHASLPDVRQACGVSRDGASALAIVNAARKYGLDAKGAKLDLDQLHVLTLPAIIHWDFNHFVVLEKVTPKNVVIVDPGSGRRSLSIEEFGQHFTGVALIFEPGESFQKRSKTYPSLSKYKEIFIEKIPNLGQVLTASILLQIIGMIFPVANQILLDRVIGPRQDAWLWGLAFGLVGAVLAKASMTLIRSYVIQGLQNTLDFTLMGRFLDHMLHLPLGFFHQRQAGDLVQRVQSNTTIRNLLGSQSISALLDIFLLTGYAGLMLAYNLKLGAWVLGLAGVRVAILVMLKDRNQQIMASELAAGGREGGALVEALTGFETTKSSGAESRMIQRWAHRMTERVNAGLERRGLSIITNQSMAFLSGATLASVFLIGGYEVLAQRMTLGVFASFMMLQDLFMRPLGSLLEAVTQMQYLGNHLRRLDDVLETEREPSGDVDPGKLAGAIEFENVSFGYSNGQDAIVKNISLSIKPGEKIALVGPSGAGKSTLARLLLGMHLPNEGNIYFDGKDIRDLNLQKLRNQMGVVLQETFLFDDTVRANLSLNDENISIDRIRESAHMACIDKVIERLPNGYLSRIGENGNLLSGGERQRLNLARALSHEPAILLLDEATSALDLETEARLHANLAKMGCTRVVIAHRLATVKDADRIFVLHNGQIVQTGTFYELEAQEGLFKILVHSTLKADEEEKVHVKELICA